MPSQSASEGHRLPGLLGVSEQHNGNHLFHMETSRAGAFQRHLSAISNLRLCLMHFHNQLGFISLKKKKKRLKKELKSCEHFFALNDQGDA